MAYRNNKVRDIRLVKAMSHEELTIDLGKEHSGTITAFMKRDSSDLKYREFQVDETGRYLTLERNKAIDLVEDGVISRIRGRWYFNVWQLKDGEDESKIKIIYTGKILFNNGVDEYNGSDRGTEYIESNVWFFQFDNTTSDIGNIGDITSEFLASNGQYISTILLKEGEDINFPNVGRYGFYVESTTNNPPYTISGPLGSINNSFDYMYQGSSAYYVSKEIATSGSSYFKFEENI
jgi:hypothetical protein